MAQQAETRQLPEHATTSDDYVLRAMATVGAKLVGPRRAEPIPTCDRLTQTGRRQCVMRRLGRLRRPMGTRELVATLDYAMLIITATAGEDRAGCLVGSAPRTPSILDDCSSASGTPT